MAFAYTVRKTGVMGDLSYAVINYTGATGTNDTITTVKGIIDVLWTPATIRASATINFTSTAGDIVLNGLTASDAGYVMVIAKGGF
jgi:hypothetical protein